MNYKQVYLKRGKEESLKRFHPWIFSGAIQHVDEGIEEGDIVRVITADGHFIAVGHFQIGSIAVRVLSFDDIAIGDTFWHNRLEEALKMRLAIGIADNPQNDTYRLVHGEGDHLPGLVIDCYGSTAVMQAHSVGMHVCRN
ncbi:MAG: PUA domain-containing protein, partial [Prevotella sp.]|nr:PUA domain-containing protein [Prevotella sp.]